MRQKFLLFAAGICMPLVGFAQAVIDLSANPYAKSTDDQFELMLPTKMEYDKTVFTDHTIYTAKNKVKAQDATATVTFTYDYATNEATPLSLTVYNKEQGVKVIDNSGKNSTFNVEMPVGTYDMHAVYKGKPAGLYAVFKEQVTISKDTTLVFKKSDADQPYTFASYNEEGTKLMLDQYANGGVAEPGNVISSSYRSYTFFTLEGMGVIHTIVGGSYRVKGYDVDLYTNKTSGRFNVLHHCNVRGKNGITYLYNFQAPLTEGKVLASDPKNLKLYEQKFCPTPAGNPENHVWGIRVWASYNGAVLLSGKAENKTIMLADSTNRFYVDLPEPANQKGFAVAASAMMGDIFTSSNQVKHIIGLPVTGNAVSGLRCVDYGYEQTFDGYIVPEGGGVAQVYPGHPRLSFTDKFSYTFGNSCPILSVKSKDYGTNSSKLLSYLGRYGELFDSGLNTVTKKTEEDGEFNKHTFTQENVKVDDIDGKNVTVLRHHKTGDDISAPSLQMLRFVNKEDRITDRFDNIEDATLEFAASDFQYHHDTKVAAKRYYEHKPLQSVEVVCAPHGTENWQTIAVTEVPELFYMPVFGYFYKAPLTNVKVEEDGWFDMKVTLTDMAGNTNTQTIMPAFYSKKFEEGTGITDVVNAKGTIKYAGGIITVAAPSQIAVYSIDGKCVATANGESVATDALSQGAYVVKAVDANGNVQTMKFVK